MLVFDNLDSYKFIEIRYKLSNDFLIINEKNKIRIDRKYTDIEEERLKEIERIELEEKNQRQRNYSEYRFVSYKSKIYYSVLNLNSFDAIDIIKLRFRELALKFHHNRFIKLLTEEQKNAEETF